MFVKNLSVALKSILRTSDRTTDNTKLPIYLSILRDETSGRLLTNPSEVLTQLTQMEPTTLSPDPTLPPGAPFPWLSYVRPTPTSSVPMLINQITPAIFQEALRRTPNHKAAGPDGVPGVVLKHMPLAFHEALHPPFKPWPLLGSPPLHGFRATPSSSIRRGTILGWTTTAQWTLLTTPISKNSHE